MSEKQQSYNDREKDEKLGRISRQLLSISQGTSTVIGEKFFENLAQCLASTFNVRYAFVGKVIDSEKNIAQMSPLWDEAEKEFNNSIVWNLKNTPCEDVVLRETRLCPKNVQESYPLAPILKKFNIESYFGIPLIGSSGERMGLISVMDDKPMTDTENYEQIIQIFADRCASEMERLKIDSERKKDEQVLKRINQSLYEKNEEMQDFFHSISHDFQAPLRKISIFSDRLGEEEKGLGKKGKDYLRRLRSSVGRMSDLMNDLVNYSQINLPENRLRSSVNLNGVGQQVIQDLEIEFKEKNGKVEIAPLATIEANPFTIRCLFHNLISNSLKYSRPNVPPVIKIRGQYPPIKNGYYEIHVQDNGIGFDDKYAVRIFKPFERLHGMDEYEGTGMGLALCNKIVRRHAGQIDVKSKVNEGTTFVIKLPYLQSC